MIANHQKHQEGTKHAIVENIPSSLIRTAKFVRPTTHGAAHEKSIIGKQS
jgi:hypothetical protein